MIFDLETAIKNKLLEIDKLERVYDYFTLKTEWYPFASFEFSWLDWDYQDSCTILREYKFNLVIVQEINQISRDQWKEIIYWVLDDIVTKFDWQMELWEWLIVNWKIIKWELWTAKTQEWEVLWLSIEISLEFEQEMW